MQADLIDLGDDDDFVLPTTITAASATAAAAAASFTATAAASVLTAPNAAPHAVIFDPFNTQPQAACAPHPPTDLVPHQPHLHQPQPAAPLPQPRNQPHATTLPPTTPARGPEAVGSASPLNSAMSAEPGTPLRTASLDPLDAILQQLPVDPLDSYRLTATASSSSHHRATKSAGMQLTASPSASDWDSLVADRTCLVAAAARATGDGGSHAADGLRGSSDLPGLGPHSPVETAGRQDRSELERSSFSSLAAVRAPHLLQRVSAPGLGGGEHGAAASQAPGPAAGCRSSQPGHPLDSDPQQPVAGAGTPAGDGAQAQQPRELLIFAVPLIKDKLVFLPVTAWKAETVDSEPAGVSGMVKSGFSNIASSFTSMWNSMKEKDPSSLQHKIHRAGVEIMENMTAEERLMRNIPAQASKLVVYHPTTMDPSEVQEQLSSMTANYCLKSVGKAAVAGLVLPVAVGLEIIAVPGTGWYALYQLYKNSVSAAGGQRLKSYLNKGADVRVNYAGDPRLDMYIERVRISPDGVLSSDDIDDLCHDLKEDSLMHPLNELRSRYIRKHVPHNSDYALLPVNAESGEHEH